MTTDLGVRPVPDLHSADRGLPLLGRSLDFAKDPGRLMQSQWDTYGSVSPLRILGQDYVMLLGAEAIGTALRNADKAFVNEPAWGRLVGPFFNRGLMLLDFEEHHTPTGGSCRRPSRVSAWRRTSNRCTRPSSAASTHGSRAPASAPIRR